MWIVSGRKGTRFCQLLFAHSWNNSKIAPSACLEQKKTKRSEPKINYNQFLKIILVVSWLIRSFGINNKPELRRWPETMSVSGAGDGGNGGCVCKQWAGEGFCLWLPEAVCFLGLESFTGDRVRRADGFTLSQSRDILAEPSQKHPGGASLDLCLGRSQVQTPARAAGGFQNSNWITAKSQTLSLPLVSVGSFCSCGFSMKYWGSQVWPLQRKCSDCMSHLTFDWLWTHEAQFNFVSPVEANENISGWSFSWRSMVSNHSVGSDL